MANKVRTLFEIEATLGEVNFYRKDGELRVRRVGRVSGQRIRTEKAFQRTRENNAEFKMAAHAGKQIRQSIAQLVKKGKDSKVSSRMLSILFKIKALDTTSLRGERNVRKGLSLPEGRALLDGFEFNVRSQMGDILEYGIVPDTANDSIDKSQFAPIVLLQDEANDATHVTMSYMTAAFDLETGLNTKGEVASVNLPMDAEGDINPLVSSLTDYNGFKVHVVLIEFFQEVNGQQYPLYNGKYNMCKILEVVE